MLNLYVYNLKGRIFMKRMIVSQIRDSIQTKEAILANDKLIDKIIDAVQMINDALNSGKKVLLAGNGGSAADAQHIAGEFVSKFYFDRPALPAIALTTDTSILTAIGNDYGYTHVFSKQLEALGNKGDVFIAISTSGNSSNLINALEVCRKKDIYSIGLTGMSGGEMTKLCDLVLNVPSRETPRIQESHILIGHIMCCLVEEAIFGINRQ